MLSENQEDFARRVYGPFYWLPFPAGLVAILYAGACLQSFWSTGKLGFVALALFASSLGVTLTTVGIRSYVVAAFDFVVAILLTALIIYDSQWPLFYLVFCTTLLGGMAVLRRRPRRMHLNGPDGDARESGGGESGGERGGWDQHDLQR
jgi:hypothetical protein